MARRWGLKLVMASKASGTAIILASKGMMISNHGDLVFKEIDAFDNLYPNQRMLLNILIFLGAQGTLFLKHLIFYANLADIVD
jgi:hypothetical protein